MTEEEPSRRWRGVSPTKVVHASSPAVHGDRDTRVLEHAGEVDAGELAALIGIEYLRPAVSDSSVNQPKIGASKSRASSTPLRAYPRLGP